MNLDFMEIAFELAEKSGDDIPVGAVLVLNGQVIASAHNEKELKQDVTAHAEIVAIRKASKKLASWRLNEAELYVTLEPCPMCATAIINSRISKVYFGSYDLVYGAFGSKLDLRRTMNSDLLVKGGILEEKCDNLLSEYFKRMRSC